jgi:anti-anti-sigma factor
MCINMNPEVYNPLSPDASHTVKKFGEKIDLTNADALTSQCNGFFNDEHITTIVFDLENVRYCDSYGLKFLIYSQRKALTANKQLVLYHPDMVLTDMFAATRLLHFFTIVEK